MDARVERGDIRGLSECLLLGGRERRKLEFCVVGHHALETDADTFNDSQEDSTHDSGVAGGLDTTTDSERSTSQETGTDRVPGIFCFANALDGAIVLVNVSDVC